MGYKVKVFYHHTDSGGVVYHANYLNFLEEARSEFLAVRGINIKELIQNGAFFVVNRQEVDYRAPAKFGDTLEITTEDREITGVRINLEHKVLKDGRVLIAEAKTTLVFIGQNFRPKPIPDDIRGKIGVI